VGAAAPVIGAAATVTGAVAGGAYFYSKWKTKKAEELSKNSTTPEAARVNEESEKK
jgi:type V secretory pathway adhesin AidA